LEVISLNWDDLLEKAAREEGKDINKQNEDTIVTTTRCLWKFHGDIMKITQDNTPGHGGWIFPDEQGYVFESFKKYIETTNLKDQLFTFLIVGYSEKEKTVYDDIINLLESNPPRPTYRISPDLKYLHQTSHIIGTAEFILIQASLYILVAKIKFLGKDSGYTRINSLSGLFTTGFGAKWIALPMVRKL
jgi:hypothetical protein